MSGPGTAVVITCSTRAATGIYPDRSWPIIVEALRGWGLVVGDVVVVPDGPDVEVALRAAISTGAGLVITTGGTGLTPTDGTPEATARVLDRLVPGIAAAIRPAGVRAGIPPAMLPRGVSGVAGGPGAVGLVLCVGGGQVGWRAVMAGSVGCFWADEPSPLRVPVGHAALALRPLAAPPGAVVLVLLSEPQPDRANVPTRATPVKLASRRRDWIITFQSLSTQGKEGRALVPAGTRIGRPHDAPPGDG